MTRWKNILKVNKIILFQQENLMNLNLVLNTKSNTVVEFTALFDFLYTTLTIGKRYKAHYLIFDFLYKYHTFVSLFHETAF